MNLKVRMTPAVGYQGPFSPNPLVSQRWTFKVGVDFRDFKIWIVRGTYEKTEGQAGLSGVTKESVAVLGTELPLCSHYCRKGVMRQGSTSHVCMCAHAYTHANTHPRLSRATLLLLKYQIFIFHSNIVFYN